jgi:uncharacterized protein YwqG
MTGEVEAIAEVTRQIAATDHIGRSNRLLAMRDRLFDAIDSHPDWLALRQAVLEHPQMAVRRAAAGRWPWPEATMLEIRARKAAGRRAAQEAPRTLNYEPRPRGCSLAEAEALIEQSLSKERADALLPLLLPAIRLWPCAHRGDSYASCFGGSPVLPRGHAWPCYEDEPLLFLGQINCADIHAAIGANPFPTHGLIQFYGDHDEVIGCGPAGSSSVVYFADIGPLQPAPAPIEDFFELPRCGLEFFRTAELPHPRSHAIARLGYSSEEQKGYNDLSRKLTTLGCSVKTYDRSSKLLGWPDLIQRDIGEDSGCVGEPLLIQFGWYHDGAEYQNWGPGGLVYFILSEKEIVEARFDRATMEMQCT